MAKIILLKPAAKKIRRYGWKDRLRRNSKPSGLLRRLWRFLTGKRLRLR